MPDNNLDNMFIQYIQQQTTAMTTIASNTEAVKNALVQVTDSVQENTKVTLEVRSGQIQYQKQAIRILLSIIVVLTLIIGGLLTRMNIKGGETITEVVEKVVK